MGTLFVFSRRASRYLLVPSFLSYILTFLYGTEKGKTLIPTLDTLYQWADDQMRSNEGKIISLYN